MRLAAVLLAVLLLPPALAQVSGEPVSFLVYRPWPDPRAGSADADPMASALAPPPREVDRLPYTLVDREARADTAPENQPESALAHYRELSRLVQSREAGGAPLTLTLSGALLPGAMEARVSPDADANVTLVLFEHKTSPYAARFVLAPVFVAANATSTQTLRLDPAWQPDRLGIVAIAERDGQVQTATWWARSDAPVVQRGKSVLVEHVTASWCDPCAPMDEALALLATQRGVAGPLDAVEPPSYLRAPDASLYAGLALGGALAVALLRGRRA